MDDLKKQLAEAYESYADVIYRLCVFKTSDTELAEDLVQDVFMRFWDYIAKGNEVANTKSFLYQTARNIIIDHYRKKKTTSLDEMTETFFQPEGDGYAEVVTEAEKNIAIKTILALDEKYREVVYLRLVEEMTIEEVADILHISKNNVTVRFHRGMQEIKLLI